MSSRFQQHNIKFTKTKSGTIKERVAALLEASVWEQSSPCVHYKSANAEKVILSLAKFEMLKTIFLCPH